MSEKQLRDALQAACNYIDTLGGVSTGYRAALSQPAPLAGEVTDEQIVAALEQEFGSDLAYRNFEDDMRAARAILALRPQAVPMTPEQRQVAFMRTSTSGVGHYTVFMRALHAADLHYCSITAKAEGGA